MPSRLPKQTGAYANKRERLRNDVNIVAETRRWSVASGATDMSAAEAAQDATMRSIQVAVIPETRLQA